MALVRYSTDLKEGIELPLPESISMALDGIGATMQEISEMLRKEKEELAEALRKKGCKQVIVEVTDEFAPSRVSYIGPFDGTHTEVKEKTKTLTVYDNSTAFWGPIEKPAVSVVDYTIKREEIKEQENMAPAAEVVTDEDTFPPFEEEQATDSVCASENCYTRDEFAAMCEEMGFVEE